MTSKSPVGDISVVTLIRTDTTLDHSQKAEKVCIAMLPKYSIHVKQNEHVVSGVARSELLARMIDALWPWRNRQAADNGSTEPNCW